MTGLIIAPAQRVARQQVRKAVWPAQRASRQNR
jgi:hypothetical protein